MKYSEQDIKRVKERADIRDFIPGTEEFGRKTYAKCPQCGKEGKKGMLVTHNQRYDNAKCFACGFSINGAIGAVMHYDNCDFVEALEKVAGQYGVELVPNDQKVKNAIKAKEDSLSDSFCLKQLKDSGLTLEDVTAKVLTPDGKNSEFVQTFRKGGMDVTGNVNFNDDEMLIFYYDLYGQPMKFATRGAAGGIKNYVRARWSNPDLHISKEGKPIKYQSPKGADVRFYIPQRIREAFSNGEHIETLVIQEGEKKAEKACKHGIMSLGIQGIYNIGNKDGGLIQDLQYLVKKCGIKNVVLLFDSDWNHMSRNIEPGDNVDMRPKQFAKAAIKFRRYVETLHNVGAFVEAWCAHINDNGKNEKGIDDLLCGSLKGNETVFADDMATAMKSHDGKGSHADFFKISALTDLQIMDIWNLRDRETFFAIHKDRLEILPNFKFGSVLYKRDDNGNIVKSTINGADTEFWKVSYNEKQKKEVEFDELSALDFLEANGYMRVISPEFGDGNLGFVSISDGIADIVPDLRLRDFLYDYAVQNCKDRDVLLYLVRKLSSSMGRERLERLKSTEIVDYYEPDVQNRYYSDGQLRITSYDIEFGQLSKTVWRDNVIPRKFKRMPVIENITMDQHGNFNIKFSERAESCQFLQYLKHASFFWKDKEDEMTIKEWNEFYRHIVNKITAIGFLLTDYKHQTESVAIVAMDGKMSEVGQSCGRSGKSLIGVALGHMVSSVVIDGKNIKADDDYMFSSVTPRTRNITFDDVRARFNFEKIFQAVAGPLMVNPKMMARFTIDFEKAPKFYITTNHTIEDSSDSARDRMVFMSFSDWYNIDHTPMMEFGNAFFSQWDEIQWTLFDNLMAECVMFYMRSMQSGWTKAGRGVVEPPLDRLHARELRQKMGEAFLQWGEAYFDESGTAINTRIIRKTMYDNFCTQFPGHQKFVSASNFRTKLIAFCEFKGLHFNPHRNHKNNKKMTFQSWANSITLSGIFEGDRDCSGGCEYFTVTTDKFAREVYM